MGQCQHSITEREFQTALKKGTETMLDMAVHLDVL